MRRTTIAVPRSLLSAVGLHRSGRPMLESRDRLLRSQLFGVLHHQGSQVRRQMGLSPKERIQSHVRGSARERDCRHRRGAEGSFHSFLGIVPGAEKMNVQPLSSCSRQLSRSFSGRPTYSVYNNSKQGRLWAGSLPGLLSFPGSSIPRPEQPRQRLRQIVAPAIPVRSQPRLADAAWKYCICSRNTKDERQDFVGSIQYGTEQHTHGRSPRIFRQQPSHRDWATGRLLPHYTARTGAGDLDMMAH